jgi:hypothetical protein
MTDQERWAMNLQCMVYTDLTSTRARSAAAMHIRRRFVDKGNLGHVRMYFVRRLWLAAIRGRLQGRRML